MEIPARYEERNALMFPDMIFVESSNIESIGYLADAMELHVQFKNGTLYAYLSVPQEIFDELLLASSKGTFLNQRIKGVFGFEKR